VEQVVVADDVIPAEVRRFLSAYVDSIAQLEALLLLYGSPDREWGADEVAKRLYVKPAEGQAVLAALAARGLLATRTEQSVLYRYAPSSDELRAAVDCVAETYRERLVPVTHFIHAKQRTNVQRFADAFRLGPEE
jgi:hypothetical protein